MGNICLQDDSKEIPVKKYCYKCGDYFKVDSGGYSQRRSCRFHNFENGPCIDCSCPSRQRNDCGNRKCWGKSKERKSENSVEF